MRCSKRRVFENLKGNDDSNMDDKWFVYWGAHQINIHLAHEEEEGEMKWNKQVTNQAWKRFCVRFFTLELVLSKYISQTDETNIKKDISVFAFLIIK